MADNVTLPGSGTSVKTDDVGGNHMQVIKLDAGGDGASIPIVGGPQPSGNSLPVVAPSDEFTTVDVAVTRPANTTAYAVNDCLSDSTSAPTTFTITNAAKASGGSGRISNAVITTNADPGTPLQGEIFLYDSSVASPNDNAAFALSDSDALKLVGKIPFALESNGGNQAFHATGLAIDFTCVGSANLRFLVRTKNAYAPANAEQFNFRFMIQRF